MDRFLLVLGRGGLLPGGLVIPQFVLDHVRSVAVSPDPVTSRRAPARTGIGRGPPGDGRPRPHRSRRGARGGRSHPKVLTLARRLGLRIGTCSSVMVDQAAQWELPVADLRGVANDLTPDHLPGERLHLDLIKEGRQSRQAVGYLPDGDMVVVNDATHLVDQGPVPVTVLSTRPTSQGVMVFAKLATEGEPADRSAALTGTWHGRSLTSDPDGDRPRCRPVDQRPRARSYTAIATTGALSGVPTAIRRTECRR